MKDTRRKVTLPLKIYESIRVLARKQRHSIPAFIELQHQAYLQVIPRTKEIEKRIARLERMTRTR